MVEAFVDTSAWYALRVANDKRHADARRILEGLGPREAQLHTSDWVMVETLSLVGRRVGRAEAVKTGEWLLRNPAVQVHPVAELLREAWELFEELGGKVSLVDCGSFAVMRDKELSRVFAFDPDFEAQGFEALK